MKKETEETKKAILKIKAELLANPFVKKAIDNHIKAYPWEDKESALNYFFNKFNK